MKHAEALMLRVPRALTGDASDVPSAGGRMRVSVRISVRDPSLILVRPLADGAPPPPGTREGFLTLAEDADAAPRIDTNESGSK